MSDTCQCVTLVKRTPIPGPTTGRMHVCQNCGKEWRVEPWGKVSVQMGTQPLAAPDVTKLAEALYKTVNAEHYEVVVDRDGDTLCKCGTWFLHIHTGSFGEHIKTELGNVLREALQKLPGTAEEK